MSKATTIGAVALGLLFVAAIVTLNSGGSVGSDASTATELDSHHNNKIKMWVGYVKQERQVALSLMQLIALPLLITSRLSSRSSIPPAPLSPLLNCLAGLQIMFQAGPN